MKSNEQTRRTEVKPSWTRPVLRVVGISEVESLADLDVAFATVSCINTLDL